MFNVKLKPPISPLVSFLFLVWWLLGIVLAKGFWIVAVAIFFPPYAFYLVVEKVTSLFGW